MPVNEFACRTPFCEECDVVFETMMKADDPDPKCPECLVTAERLWSSFAAPWTGTLDRYDRRGCETQMPCDGGHIAWRIRSTRHADGSAEPVRIRNRQEQVAYCKAEGVTDPTDVNPNIEGNADGSWGNTSGFSGQWGGTPSFLAKEPEVATWRVVVDGVACKQA